MPEPSMLALSLPKTGQRSWFTASEADLLKCKTLLRKHCALNRTSSTTFESCQLNRIEITALASSKAKGQADLK